MRTSLDNAGTRVNARFVLGVVLAGLVLAGGCSSTPRSPDGTPGRISRTALITEDELLEVREVAVTAFEAVRRLRPAWLRTRGPVSLERLDQTAVRVYVDGAFRGTADELKGIPTPNVLSIRFLSPPEATTRFGPNHMNGAIMVSMRR